MQGAAAVGLVPGPVSTLHDMRFALDGFGQCICVEGVLMSSCADDTNVCIWSYGGCQEQNLSLDGVDFAGPLQGALPACIRHFPGNGLVARGHAGEKRRVGQDAMDYHCDLRLDRFLDLHWEPRTKTAANVVPTLSR